MHEYLRYGKHLAEYLGENLIILFAKTSLRKSSLYENEMKIFLFEASLTRNIKFSMMIFSSIASTDTGIIAGQTLCQFVANISHEYLDYKNK